MRLCLTLRSLFEKSETKNFYLPSADKSDFFGKNEVFAVSGRGGVTPSWEFEGRALKVIFVEKMGKTLKICGKYRIIIS